MEQAVQFPLRGLFTAAPYDAQPDGTAPAAANVRAFDTLAGRMRGGSRPGIARHIDQDLGGLIQNLNSIVLPSATALGISFDDVPILDVSFQITDPGGLVLADGTTNWIYVNGSGYATPASYTRRYDPEITGVSPASGPFAGGEAVTITGNRLGGLGSRFTFGQRPARVVANDGSTATVIAPAQEEQDAPLEVDVVVNTGSGQSGVSDDAKYTYGEIQFVQATATDTTDTADEVSVTLPVSAPTSQGNLILVAVSETVDGGSEVDLTVTDSDGNTYTLIRQQQSPAFLQPIAYLFWAIAKSTASLTVTVTLTTDDPLTDVYLGAAVLEYSGVNSATPVDASVGTAGGGNNWTTGDVPVNFAACMVVGVFAQGQFNLSVVAPTGYELRVSRSGAGPYGGIYVADLIGVDEATPVLVASADISTAYAAVGASIRPGG